MTGTNQVSFIAPNGARVSVSNWSEKVVGSATHKRWHTEVMMHIIFADPMLEVMA